jgi:hypothetical protein
MVTVVLTREKFHEGDSKTAIRLILTETLSIPQLLGQNYANLRKLYQLRCLGVSQLTPGQPAAKHTNAIRTTYAPPQQRPFGVSVDAMQDSATMSSLVVVAAPTVDLGRLYDIDSIGDGKYIVTQSVDPMTAALVASDESFVGFQPF